MSGAKQRHSDALGAAKEYYRLARESLDCHLHTDRAIAQALLGILRLQIELFEPVPELGEPH